ncbi:MAG: class I SAM-dependent methyltransferase [Candidatus Hydrogenedentes bacterium]|nr:class I SAM-dependent methyltransferase [Candidatus Hydrogenedentota bacterium]
MQHYRDDLAFIHNAGFGGLAEHAASFLLEQLHEQHLDRGLVVDLGCGSGILAERLSIAGYSVLGIDLSNAMIELARRRAPEAEFRVQSLLATVFPPCIAVTAIGEIFNYDFDDRAGLEALKDMAARVYHALPPEGVFMFDAAAPGRVPGGSTKTFFEGDDWSVLVTADETAEPQLVTRRITSYRKVDPGQYRRDDETHQLKLFTRVEVNALLENAGFRVTLLERYGSHDLLPGLPVYLAVKPGSG